jgi:hypothetical protein
LYWTRITFARMAGTESGNWFKFFGAEIAGLLIFILGNLGTRAIGAISLKTPWSRNFKIFIVTFLLLSLILPLLFIQKGANFNTIQFFYYHIFIFNFLSAGAL